jgi:metallo-beta-lactamase family protein
MENRDVYLQSLGAAETVTGSKHLLITPDFKLMVDCGLFQGIKSLREKNWIKPPVDVTTIDAILITHAHLDHCGYLPLLIKNGYKGKVYMSEPTRDLTELILRDSAKLQEEDADKANRHGYSKHSPALPLYNTKDVEAALLNFVTVDILKEYRLNPHIWFKFYPAGHILGACSAEVNCYDKTILFSGDIGRYHSEMLPAPQHPKTADYLVMESTYGDRLHKIAEVKDELAFVIKDTLFHGGNLLIPCFAVGRAQDVIHLLYKLKQEKAIPNNVPVFLDSPMAASASKSLLRHTDWLMISTKECAQMFSGITISQDYRETKKIIRQRNSKIILAASGMMTGGRVLEYLKHYLPDAKNTILLIGYQAEGTRGRALLNQAPELKIHGQYYPVTAQVKEIGGLSAHADQAELLRWLKDFNSKPSGVYLVHGEPSAQDALRVKIKDEYKVTPIIVKENQREFLFTIEGTETEKTNRANVLQER